MKLITVGKNQSIYDVAVQYYGHTNAILQLMIDNPGLCDFQNQITPGTKLWIDETKIIDGIVVEYLKKKNLSPSTAADADPVAFSSGFSLGFQ